MKTKRFNKKLASFVLGGAMMLSLGGAVGVATLNDQLPATHSHVAYADTWHPKCDCTEHGDNYLHFYVYDVTTIGSKEMVLFHQYSSTGYNTNRELEVAAWEFNYGSAELGSWYYLDSDEGIMGQCSSATKGCVEELKDENYVWDFSKTASDNVTAHIHADGTIHVFGKGAMKDFASNDASNPWSKSNGTFMDGSKWNESVTLEWKKIVVDEGVTSIGANAFYGEYLDRGWSKWGAYLTPFSSVSEIVIANSVTEIGENAFASSDLEYRYRAVGRVSQGRGDNEKAKTVTIGSGIQTIGAYAFGSTTLAKVTINAKNVTMASDVFSKMPGANITSDDNNDLPRPTLNLPKAWKGTQQPVQEAPSVIAFCGGKFSTWSKFALPASMTGTPTVKEDLVYTGSPVFPLDLTDVVVDDGTIVFSVNGGATWLEGLTDVGEYTDVLYKVKGEVADFTPENNTISFSIEKGENDITSDTSKVGITYGSSDNPYIKFKWGTPSFEYYMDEDCTTKTTAENSGATEEGGKPTKAGKYYIKATVGGTDNYYECIKVVEFNVYPLQLEFVNSYENYFDGYGFLSDICSEHPGVSHYVYSHKNTAGKNKYDYYYSKAYQYNAETERYYVYYISKPTFSTPCVRASNDISGSCVANETIIYINASGNAVKCNCIGTISNFQEPTNSKFYAVQVGGVTKTYNGNAQALATINLKNLSNTVKSYLQYKLGEDGTWSSTIPTATMPGTYTIYARINPDYDGNVALLNADDYTITSTIDPITVATNDVAISGTYTFDGTTKTPVFTYKGTALVEGTDYEVEYDSEDFINAGSMTATLTFKGVYSGTVEKTFTIAKAEPLMDYVEVEYPTDAVYNGSPFTASVSLKEEYNTEPMGVGVPSIVYKQGNTTVTDPTDAGTYDVYVQFAEGVNHGAKTATKVGSFTIAKRTVRVPVWSGTGGSGSLNYTYNGNAQSIPFINPQTDRYTITGNSGTNAGTYSVNVALKDKTNNVWENGNTNDLTYTFKIAKANITNTNISSFAGMTPPANLVYDGTAKMAEAWATELGMDNIGTITLTYKKNGVDVESPTDGGEYEVYATITAGNNYNALTTPTKLGSFTIAQATNELTTNPTLSNWTYGSTPNDPTGAVVKFGEVKYEYYKDEGFTIKTTAENSGATEEGGRPANAGLYFVKAIVDETDNYTGISEMVGTLLISKLEIEKPVVADVKVGFDGQEHSVGTYDADQTYYTVTGTTASTKVINNKVTFALKDKVNYVWKNSEGSTTDIVVTLLIAKLQLLTSTSISTAKREQAESGYCLNPAHKNEDHLIFTGNYGGNLHFTKIGADGTVINDWVQPNFGGSYVYGQMYCDDVACNDYIYYTQEVSVAPSAKTVTFSGSAQQLINAGKVIAGSGYALQYSLNNQTWVTDATQITATTAGTYTVYYKLVVSDSQYAGCYTIEATKNLQITLSPKALTAGDVNVDGTYTYNGNAQNPVIKFGDVTLVAGTDYDINFGSESNVNAKNDIPFTLTFKGNYSGNNVQQSFTINKQGVTTDDGLKALLTYTAPSNLTYDKNSKSATVAPATGVNGLGTITVKYKNSQGDYVENPTNADTYTVFATVAEGDNYGEYATEVQVGSFTIAKRTLTATEVCAATTYAPAENLVYSATAKPATVTSEDTDFGNITIIYKDANGTVVANPTNVGTYDVYITATATANYNAVAEAVKVGQFSITKMPMTAEALKGLVAYAPNSDLEYDATAKPATVTAKDGVVGLGNITIIYRDSEGEVVANPTVAGEYSVYVKVAEGDNYGAFTEEVLVNTFTITKQVITNDDHLRGLISYTAPTELVYDGEERLATIVPAQDIVGLGTITVKYKNSQGNYVDNPTNADTYTVFAVLDEGDNYGEYTTEVEINNFTIAKAIVTKPVEDTTRYIYNGQEKTYVIAENSLYTVTGNKMTAVGKQTVTISLNDKANYDWNDETTDDITFTFKIWWTNDQHIDTTISEEPIVKVEALGGIDPDHELKVQVIDEKNEDFASVVEKVKSTETFKVKDKVFGVYGVSLINKETNAVEQPDHTISLYLSIPKQIRGGEFTLYHIHDGVATLVEYELDGDYAVVATSELSEFVFVYERTSLLAWMIALSVLIFIGLCGAGWQVYNYEMKKKGKKGLLTLPAAVPVFYMPGHLEAVTALAVILGVVILVNVALLLLFTCKKTSVKLLPLFTAKKANTTEEPEEAPVEEAVDENVAMAQEVANAWANSNKPANTETAVTYAEPAHEGGLTLGESFEIASHLVADKLVTKQSIVEYLTHTFGEEVLCNARENLTKTGLPLADTHYTLKRMHEGKMTDKKSCFIYVYENDGITLLIAKAPASYMEEVKAEHKYVALSAFPKTRDYATWYSVPVDESWTPEAVYKFIADVKHFNEDADHVPAKNIKVVSSNPEGGLTLGESFEIASHLVADKLVTKQSIVDYLTHTFGEEVLCNARENLTKTGLPLADTHYTLKRMHEGKMTDKKSCFIYVYENDGITLLIAKAPVAYMDTVKAEHKYVALSAFPKTRDYATWYSVPVDESWTPEAVYKFIADVKHFNEDADHVPARHITVVDTKPQEAWVEEDRTYLTEHDLGIQDDENGEEVIGVFFKHRKHKIYWFKYDNVDFALGEVACYQANEGDMRDVVVAIPKVKKDMSGHEHDLKPLCKKN